LYQGVSAFELWNNLKVDAEKTQLVYEKMKEELKINE
jgi:shikimate 5-dehydrogenase